MSRGELLRSRDFRLLAASIGVSALGDWLAAVPLILFVQRLTDSGLAVSALLICLWSPSVVLAGHVGVLVDRFETTRLLAVVAAAQAAVATSLAFADSLAPVLVLTGLLGIGFAISQAAEFALVPAVTGAGSVRLANGYVETARYSGFVIGPVVGGVLAGAGGTSLAMLVNAATFVFVALASLALRTRRVPVAAAAEEPVRAREGVTQLFRDPTLGLAMSIAFVSLLFMSASIPADVFFVKDVLGVGDAGFGIVYAAWTIGMVLGALVLSKRAPAGLLVVVAFAAVALQGLGKALTPLWLVFGFMLVCYFGGGVGHGLKNVMFRTLIHERVPAERHGRVFAAYNGIRNAAELGALAVGGVLVAAVGARGTLWIAGGLSALAGLVGLALLPRVSRERETAVEGPPALTG